MLTPRISGFKRFGFLAANDIDVAFSNCGLTGNICLTDSTWLAVIFLVTDWLIRLGLSVRVIVRRLPVGTSLAWLFVLLATPLLGVVAYLLIGELRLGSRRAKMAAKLAPLYQAWCEELQARSHVDWDVAGQDAEPVAQLVQNSLGLPPQSGNAYTLLGRWDEALDAVIRDIDAARRSCHLAFYIWNAGGKADDVAEALLRAAARGVSCLVLLDDVGSRPFLRGPWPQRLREAGIQVVAALPASLWRLAFTRYDLRLHRKLVLVDCKIAYTGSLNLVDPRHFKQNAGVGQWVDAMVRVQGPVVEPLAILFLGDWAFATGIADERLRELSDVHPVRPVGPTAMQVIPSGPGQEGGRVDQVLLTTIYRARRRIVLTSPYFIPHEPLLAALIGAAQRGVDVELVIPERVDSRLAHHAGRAFLRDLVAAGVRVHLFRDGLLHTKSVLIDDSWSLFGSLNLDPRSMFLNFELTLAIYDRDFAANLARLQDSYIARSRPLEFQECQNQPFLTRFVQDLCRLFEPLL